MKVQRASCDYSLKLWRARRAREKQTSKGRVKEEARAQTPRAGRVGSGRVTGVGGAELEANASRRARAWQRRAALLPDVLTERTDKKSSELTLPKGKTAAHKSAMGRVGRAPSVGLDAKFAITPPCCCCADRQAQTNQKIPLSRLELGGTQGWPSEEPSPTQHRAMQAGHASNPGTIRQAAASHSPIPPSRRKSAHNNARQQECPRDVGG